MKLTYLTSIGEYYIDTRTYFSKTEAQYLLDSLCDTGLTPTKDSAAKELQEIKQLLDKKL